jgi:hypothetical protein
VSVRQLYIWVVGRQTKMVEGYVGGGADRG